MIRPHRDSVRAVRSPSIFTRRLALFSVLFMGHYCAAIQANLDSLFQVWQDTTRHDTIRLDALNRFLFSDFLHQDPDSALRINEARLALAKAKGYRQAEAEAYNLRGYILFTRGDHAKAITNYTDCLRIYEQLGKRTGIGAALSGIGSIYYHQGEHAKALDYFERGLKANEEAGHEPGIAICLNNMGNVYADKGEPEKALEYYERVLKIRKARNDVRSIASTLNNIALVHADMALVDDREERTAQAAAQRKVAIDKLNESIGYYQEVGDHQGECGAFANIASIYADEGGRDPEIIQYSLKALPIAKEHGLLTEAREIHFALSRAYQRMGKHALALDMYKEYILIRDSIRSEDNKQEILRQQMQYDFDKKEAKTLAEQEKRDAVAKQDLRRQKVIRNAFMGGFMLVALFAGVFLSQRNRISKEKARSEELLLNILPEEVAEELKAKGEADARLIDQVTVLFTDFKGFTAMSEVLTPKDLVRDLHECFSAFDRICEKHHLEKIKTIGDAYMAAGGLPVANTTHALDVINAALEMRDFIAEGKARKIATGQPYFEVRIGVHSGPVVAGIVGVKKFSYDIWGDTVNTASRMESSGEAGQVNISEATHDLLKDGTGLTFAPRGKVQAKGKGEMEMYFVRRSSEEAGA
ncbi:MAG TPA: adenylate/guanylate cyclase domain-containing protein [Flavobacteriales bacterium]|nr:adenylate/guanylate cyclase domain-containing protein [Flavobacteriales bacterium]